MSNQITWGPNSNSFLKKKNVHIVRAVQLLTKLHTPIKIYYAPISGYLSLTSQNLVLAQNVRHSLREIWDTV